MIIPPPLPKEPFDPSPSSRTEFTTDLAPSAKGRALQSGIAIGKFGVVPLGLLYGVALIIKAVKPSWAGPIDDVLKYLRGE